jgi:hypothetical protein
LIHLIIPFFKIFTTAINQIDEQHNLQEYEEQQNLQEYDVPIEEIAEEDRPEEQDLAHRPVGNQEINERVRAYFGEYDQETKSRKCNRCNTPIKGNLSHLKTHLSAMHVTIARALGLIKRNRTKRPRETEEAQEETLNEDEEVEPPPKKIKRVNINITIRELVKYFLKSNTPLNNAELMKDIQVIKNQFDAHNKVFNRKKLREYILQAAGEVHGRGEESEPTGIYKEIANEVRGKLPSLMFDSASRHGRHVFSASLRYAKGDKLIDRTIGVITQHQRQTAANLFGQIEQLLRKVGLNIDDIYSTCTDQGTNMLKAADLTSEAQKAIRIVRDIANFVQEDDEAGINFNHMQVQEEAEERDVAQMLYQEAEVDRVLEEQEEEEQQQEEEEEEDIADIVADGGTLCTKMVCGAHTCQLAVKDILRHFKAVTNEIREVVKVSKRLEFAEILHAARIKKLRLDTETRWDSLFDMISDFHKFRNQLMNVGLDNELLALSENAWQFIAEFIQVFTPVHFAMKDFQRADITMSEFYISWENMELEISLCQGQLKDDLLQALGRRKKKFFECDAFIAALLLDPRINWSNSSESFFNPELRERGILQIEKIHQVLTNRGQFAHQQEQNREQQQSNFEALDQRLGGGRRGQGQTWQNNEQPTTIRQQINSFLAEMRLSSGVQLNPLKYWYSKRDEEPDIYKVSQVVYGAAFSQVKVERDFSGFALVLTHLRTLLADNTLNAILVFKKNLDLLDRVKFY